MGGKCFVPFWEILVDSRAVGFILIAGTIFSLTLSILPAPQPVHHSLLQPALVIIGVIAGKLAGCWSMVNGQWSMVRTAASKWSLKAES
jgi:hypothetical protein